MDSKKIFNIPGITALIVFLALSCKTIENRETGKLEGLCKNELGLLSSFDSLPIWTGDFKSINIEPSKQVSGFFESDSMSGSLHFNVYHHIDSKDSIKLSLNIYYQGENCPESISVNMALRGCFIWLLSKGQVQFNPDLIPLDSLHENICRYYSKAGKQNYYPDSYDKVNFFLSWDNDVSESDFTAFINQLIIGYLDFANELSMEIYNKKVCRLNLEELGNLAKIIPLNVHIPEVITIEAKENIEVELPVF